MRIDWQTAPLSDWQSEALIFFFFEQPTELLPGVGRWIAERDPQLPQSAAFKDFRAKLKETAVYYNASDHLVSRLILVGLGPKDKFDSDKLRSASVAALRKCKELQLNRPALPLLAFEGLGLGTAEALEEALIAATSGLYQYGGFKTRDTEEESHPAEILILSVDEPDEALRSATLLAGAISSGIFLTRDLVSAPANKVTPSTIVEVAERLAQSYGFKLNSIDIETAKALGMGAFTAVAQGSREPAAMIVLEHAPAGHEDDKPVVLIGKGITFDTGGISLKPSDKMEAMKQDMAGAATVLGAFEAFGRIQLKKRVIGILPCTENMPGGKAYKPGDVIHSLSGLTIEVISTDAEGRMVLSDALAYGMRFQPAMVVDIATLTGACIIALGHQVAAVMGNNENFVKKIQEVGANVGEKFWPLPLWDLYFENIKSEVADFRNVGDRSAGTIIGGIFLKQFVSDEVPWAHLDIAGTAWTSKDLGVAPQGATGFGVRTLIELVLRGTEFR